MNDHHHEEDLPKHPQQQELHPLLDLPPLLPLPLVPPPINVVQHLQPLELLLHYPSPIQPHPLLLQEQQPLLLLNYLQPPFPCQPYSLHLRQQQVRQAIHT
jgi:hypothetical protein